MVKAEGVIQKIVGKRITLESGEEITCMRGNSPRVKITIDDQDQAGGLGNLKKGMYVKLRGDKDEATQIIATSQDPKEAEEQRRQHDIEAKRASRGEHAPKGAKQARVERMPESRETERRRQREEETNEKNQQLKEEQQQQQETDEVEEDEDTEGGKKRKRSHHK